MVDKLSGLSFKESSPLKHVALGLVLREMLAPWTGHAYDFEIWVRLGFYMQNLGSPYRHLPYVPGLSFAPYPTVGSISYPPFSAFIFALTYRLYQVLGEPSRFLYYFLLKQPMILGDIGIALVLSRIILLSGNAGLAKNAFKIWLYLPSSVIISSVWGQLDPLALFLMLLAVYFFTVSKWLPSAAMLGLSIFLKTLPVIFLPVFLMQRGVGLRTKSAYSLVSLIIPAIGTLAPASILGWAWQGVFNNMSFQVAIPFPASEMSLLGQVYSFSSVPPSIRYLVGSLWIPVLLISYYFCYRKRLSLVPGFLVVVLSFSMSRSFLPVQWSLYPLAFLLIVFTGNAVKGFVGLAVSSTVFVVLNYQLMVWFFSPISSAAFYWEFLPSDTLLRAVTLGAFASLYFLESLLVLLRKESFIHRVMVWATPVWLQWSRVPELRAKPS